MTQQLIAGHPAPDVTLSNDLGQPTKLSELWTRHPIALVFVRHTG